MRLQAHVAKTWTIAGLALLAVLAMSGSAFAQGSIFGAVSNSDASTPANGEISFVGYLDDTDEEIRLESSDGAGYDNGNWFDDFQNYGTEAAGNPYDYVFFNTTNSEGFQLSGAIPNNSFQQEDVTLASVSWPAAPSGIVGSPVSSSAVVLRWTPVPGVTYHIYRRLATSNGSFFRIDNPAGSLADRGVSDSFFVDQTVDGVNSYDYVFIAEDNSGNWSPHSAVFTINSAVLVAPVLDSIVPANGPFGGGTPVTLYGSNFDIGGATGTIGGSALTSVTVVSPFELTGVSPSGTAGPADVFMTNSSAALASNTLTGGFVYDANTAPTLNAIGPQNVNEGDVLNFVVTATDPDGDTPALSTSALPGTATFNDNSDGTGTFNWATTFSDSGTYSVTFYATDSLTPALVDSEVVVITVGQVNLAPVLTTISDQTTDENVLLTFGVTATDGDGTTPVLSASPLPGTATFNDNTDGTGTFDWTPTFDDSGTYLVTFYATDSVDAGLVDSQQVTISVTNVNRGPVLATIGAQPVDENANLNFAVTASDPDNNFPVLTTSTPLPGTATFNDNGDGTGVFDWTPTFDDSGTYLITFYATDSVDAALVDSEVVTVTVANVNRDPVLAAIGSQSVAEGDLLSFGVSASDPDNNFPVLTTSTPLPGTAVFNDNGDGTGTFDWTTTFGDSGTYQVTFYATDSVDAALVDSEVVTISVGNVNLAPALTAIGAQSIPENSNLNFAVTATDPDGDSPVLTTSTPLPGTAIFTDNGGGAGVFDWTPTYDDSGTYLITFYATDSVDAALVDSEVVTVTVTNVNREPVLDPIADQNVTEDNPLSFGVTASDADGNIPVLTTSVLPGTAIFTDSGNGTGTFDWTPGFADAGIYPITFYATDSLDAGLIDSQVVTVTVIDAGNQAPVLDPISDQFALEGGSLTVAITAVDPDGPSPVLFTSPLPGTATFVDSANGVGVFDWSPTFGDAGVYPVTFYAADSADLSVVDSQAVTITITDINQPPVLDPISDATILEDSNLVFTVTATDGDGPAPILTTSTLPENATFADSGNGVGVFDWTPTFAESGVYPITFYATDSLDNLIVDSQLVTITVNDAGNQPPALGPLADTSLLEGDSLVLLITATDVDGTIPTISALNLPATNATFTDSGNGTAVFEFYPDYDQSGTYPVTFIADDGTLADSVEVQIDVTEVGNVAPVITPISDQFTIEGGTLEVFVDAVDPDGGGVAPTLTIVTSLNNYIFTDSGNGHGLLVYTPSFYDAGIKTVRINATDHGTPVRTTSELFQVNTDDINQAPEWVDPGPRGVTIGKRLSVTLTATDSTDPGPAGPLLLSLLSVSPIPPDSFIFVDNGNNTGTFTFWPQLGEEGVYDFEFLAVDQGTPTQSAVLPVQVTVVTANLPPLLDSIPPQVIIEGGSLQFAVSGSDPDGPPPAILAERLPDNATFVDSGNGVGVVTFDPNFVQSGIEAAEFRAYDGIDVSPKKIVLIQVIEAGDQQPQFDPITVDTVTEGGSLSVTITGFDPDTLPVSFSVDETTLPENATFADNGDGSATIEFNPDYVQAGLWDVTIFISDGVLTDTTVVTLDVTEAGPQPPVMATIADQQVNETDSLSFVITTTDPDQERPFLSAAPLPTGAGFIDRRDFTGVFGWKPTNFQAGEYQITFYATDSVDAGLVDSQLVTITVINENQIPRYLFPSGQDDDVFEGDTLYYRITATDPDSTIPRFDAHLDGIDSLARNMTFTDSANGVGLLTFTPDYTQGIPIIGNSFFVVFDVIDAEDSTFVTTTPPQKLTVHNANQPPELIFVPDSVGPFTLTEGGNLSFNVGGVDGDGATVPTVSAFNLPANATFTGQTDFKSFAFNPDFTQAGAYQVGFVVTDVAGGTDSQLVDITVVEAGNQAPSITTSVNPTYFVTVGNPFELNLTAIDPDNDPITMRGEPLASGMLFADSGNGHATFYYIPELGQTTLPVEFIAEDAAGLADTMATELTVVSFLRGDLDLNNKYTMNDLAVLVNYLYRLGPEPPIMEAADVNLDSRVDSADLGYLIEYLYSDGAAPPQ